ncbi:hypothetical protein [His2 virus]|uniref:Uncharacterized protein n=1 Tax=His 2 virus TaxID=128710 RepID=Q25BD4_HIS2V|nr:hypothetical protein His2V_gp26 [His2 virus]AAQ13796.1 hypothetical protein [His2 virus]
MAIRDKSPVMLLMGLMVLVTSLVTFRIADIEVLNNAINPISGWIFVVGFVGIYLISDREVGQLKNYEGAALLVPVLVAIAVQSVPEFESTLTQYNPALGIMLFAVTMVGFYALATNMNLTYVVLELLLGVVLGVTAAVQYNILEIQVLSANITQISIWVFVLTLASAYLVSERSLGTFTRTEIGSMAFGIGTYVAYTFIPEVEQFVVNNNPATGIVLTLGMAFAFYVIMNNGQIRV